MEFDIHSYVLRSEAALPSPGSLTASLESFSDAFWDGALSGHDLGGKGLLTSTLVADEARTFRGVWFMVSLMSELDRDSYAIRLG